MAEKGGRTEGRLGGSVGTSAQSEGEILSTKHPTRQSAGLRASVFPGDPVPARKWLRIKAAKRSPRAQNVHPDGKFPDAPSAFKIAVFSL